MEWLNISACAQQVRTVVFIMLVQVGSAQVMTDCHIVFLMLSAIDVTHQ